jgi:GR25 family glycosyltransferase involved in LPS biosynthesis
MKNKYEKYLILLCVIVILLIQLLIVYNKESLTNNYLQDVDIIYWINLDRSKDRYNKMNKLFNDDVFQNIPRERISAFDAKNNPQSVFDKLVFTKRLERADTVYGCLLSHLEAIKTFNESNYNIALICEDDMNLDFKKYWKKNVKQIMDEAPNDWDIIMLAYTINSEHKYANWNNIKEDYIKDLTASAVAYLINKKGSNKIINTTYKEDDKYHLNSKIPTHTSDGYLYLLTNTYVYKYPMFTYNTENEPSTISEHHEDFNSNSKNLIIQQYKQKYPEI